MIQIRRKGVPSEYSVTVYKAHAVAHRSHRFLKKIKENKKATSQSTDSNALPLPSRAHGVTTLPHQVLRDVIHFAYALQVTLKSVHNNSHTTV
jgi:hypothetical protein